MAGVTLINLSKIVKDEPMPTVAEEAKKRRSTPAGTPVEIRKRSATDLDRLQADIAKFAATVATTTINARVDEAMALVKKGDNRAARELLSDAETYEAYHARMAGERYVAVARSMAIMRLRPDAPPPAHPAG